MDDLVVMEIRGVGGATAEEILGADVTQVAGDQLAGFYRTSEPGDAREAYEWGRLTSGSRVSAMWWILFPFTLINVAGWMFRPRPEELARAHEPRMSSLWFVRVLNVLGSLALTGVYVVWTITIATEILVFGCVSDEACRDRWYFAPLSMFSEQPGVDNALWLSVLAVGLAALPILGLFAYVLRTQDRLEGYETDPTRRLIGTAPSETGRLRRNTQLQHQAFWYKWAEHRLLVRWHLGLTMVLIGIASGHILERRGTTQVNARAWWAIALILAGIVLVLWTIARPEKYRERTATARGERDALQNRVGWTLIHLSLGAIGGAVGYALSTGLMPDDYTGFAFLWLIRNAFIILVFGALAVVAVMLVRQPSLATSATAPSPAMPGLASSLAVFIGVAGFASLANLTGRIVLNAEWVRDNDFSIAVVDFLAVGVVAVLAALGVRMLWGRRPTAEVMDDYFAGSGADELSDRDAGWVSSVARGRKIARLPRDADGILGWLSVVMLTLGAIHYAELGFGLHVGPSRGFSAPLFGIEGLASFHTIAATVIVLYLFPGVQLIRANATSRASRRQLGKVWDVLSFWPRRFHPLAAPCYAERAVPEFRNRIREHLNEGRRVVISAHSQGTVIAFAALLQIAEEDERIEDGSAPSGPAYKEIAPQDAVPERALANVSLVTFGSPLTTLYGRFFPWHFGMPGRMQGLRDRLAAAEPELKAWRNLWRPTDYIGQEVFVSPGGGLEPIDGLADIRVLESNQPLFPYESHSNYEDTAELRETIYEFCGRTKET